MKPLMTKEEAQAWRERWRLVNEFEIEELRRTPVETKLLQLAALMRMGRAFGWDKGDETEVQPVRDLWVRLKTRDNELR